ncbi:hypothetical protein CBL_00672 [Carabus blaptoides fortunei]
MLQCDHLARRIVQCRALCALECRIACRIYRKQMLKSNRRGGPKQLDRSTPYSTSHPLSECSFNRLHGGSTARKTITIDTQVKGYPAVCVCERDTESNRQREVCSIVREISTGLHKSIYILGELVQLFGNSWNQSQHGKILSREMKQMSVRVLIEMRSCDLRRSCLTGCVRRRALRCLTASAAVGSILSYQQHFRKMPSHFLTYTSLGAGEIPLLRDAAAQQIPPSPIY